MKFSTIINILTGFFILTLLFLSLTVNFWNLDSDIEIINSLLILLFVAVLIANYIVIKTVSHPLRKLTHTIDVITKGKLNEEIPEEVKNSKNEVGTLAESLERILASLKLAILRTGVSKKELGLGEAIKAKEAAEEKYKVLYESSSDALVTLSPPGWNFTAANPSAIKLFGAKNEASLVKTGPDKLSPKYQPDKKLSSKKSKEMVKIAMEKGSHYFEWKHKDLKGREFPATVLLTKVKIKNKNQLQGTIRDITKEKAADKEIQKAQEKCMNIFNTINRGVAVYEAVGDGKDFIFTDFNKEAEKIEGMKKSQVIGKSVTEVFPGVKKSGIFKRFVEVWKTGKPQEWKSNVYEDKRRGKSIRENYIYKLSSGEIVAVYQVVKANKK